MEIVGEWKVDPDSRTSRRVKLGRLKGNYYAGAGYLTGTRVLGLPSMSARHASLWASAPAAVADSRGRHREPAAPPSMRGSLRF